MSNEQYGLWNIPNKSTADSCLAEVTPNALPLCKLRRRAWFSAIKHWSSLSSLLHSPSKYLLLISRSLTCNFFLSLDLTAASLFLNCLKNQFNYYIQQGPQHSLSPTDIKWSHDNRYSIAEKQGRNSTRAWSKHN
jgi:hypothetical protein